MKSIVIGAHLRREDVEPVADAIPVGDLFLSALTVADDQPIGDRDLLLRVAATRARLLEAGNFVAIRYGFTTASAEDALAKCAALVPRWKRVLDANRDNVEITLKVAASSPMPRPDRRDFTSGADYLRRLHAVNQATNVDPEFRAAVERVIVPLAVKSRWQHRDEHSVELAALIPRTLVGEALAAGEILRTECPAVPFLLSGPWPLEVFADDDHE
jgi:hypothetical protein